MKQELKQMINSIRYGKIEMKLRTIIMESGVKNSSSLTQAGKKERD